MNLYEGFSKDGLIDMLEESEELRTLQAAELAALTARLAQAERLVEKWNSVSETMLNSHDEMVREQGAAISDCADALAETLKGEQP